MTTPLESFPGCVAYRRTHWDADMMDARIALQRIIAHGVGKKIAFSSPRLIAGGPRISIFLSGQER